MEWTHAHNWQYLLFENPLPLSITLTLAGLLLWWHGIRRQDRKARRIAPVFILLAIGSWMMALSVTTPREIVRERATALVNLTAPLSPAGLHDFFDPSASLVGPGSEVYLPEGTLNAKRLATNVSYWKIDGHWIKSIKVEMQKGHRATTLVRLRTTLSSEWGSQPAHTDWQIMWIKSLDGTWRVEKVIWLKLNGKTPAPSIMR